MREAVRAGHFEEPGWWEYGPGALRTPNAAFAGAQGCQLFKISTAFQNPAIDQALILEPGTVCAPSFMAHPINNPGVVRMDVDRGDGTPVTVLSQSNFSPAAWRKVEGASFTAVGSLGSVRILTASGNNRGWNVDNVSIQADVGDEVGKKWG